MMVCDICMKPDPTYTGSPWIRKGGEEEYMFRDPRKGNNNSNRVDFCEECLALLRNRSWGRIAEKAQEVLLLRLGVTADGETKHDTSKHNPHCNPSCPDWSGKKGP